MTSKHNHLLEDFFHIEEKKKESRAFRRKWVPAFKTILASLADVVGDWVFYNRIKNGDDAMDYLERYLFFFAVVSSVLGAFSIFSIAMNNCVCLVKNTFAHKEDCLKKISFLLGLEMFCEDIPQVILTYLVMTERNGGEWSPVGVFNLTTSMFNFTFNILDMIMPLDEIHHEEDTEQRKQEKYQQHTGMAVEDDVNQGGNSDGGNYHAPVPLPQSEVEHSNSGDTIASKQEVTIEDHKSKDVPLVQSTSTISVGFDQLKEKILSGDNDNNLIENIPPSQEGHIV